MMNDELLYNLNKINRKHKEELLWFLLTLEKQEMLNSQELAFAFPQKDA